MPGLDEVDYGLRGWLVQRVSAVVMAAYAVVFLATLVATRPAGHAAWR